MTRKKNSNSKSNSFVAAAEQVCLQPVLEHRQRSEVGEVAHALRLTAIMRCDTVYGNDPDHTDVTVVLTMRPNFACSQPAKNPCS